MTAMTNLRDDTGMRSLDAFEIEAIAGAGRAHGAGDGQGQGPGTGGGDGNGVGRAWANYIGGPVGVLFFELGAAVGRLRLF